MPKITPIVAAAVPLDNPNCARHGRGGASKQGLKSASADDLPFNRAKLPATIKILVKCVTVES